MRPWPKGSAVGGTWVRAGVGGTWVGVGAAGDGVGETSAWAVGDRVSVGGTPVGVSVAMGAMGVDVGMTAVGAGVGLATGSDGMAVGWGVNQAAALGVRGTGTRGPQAIKIQVASTRTIPGRVRPPARTRRWAAADRDGHTWFWSTVV